MIFWLNGEFRDEAAAIDIADRGFLLGDGVFETLLARDGAPAFLGEHLERLKSGLKTLEIKAFLPQDLAGIVRRLVEKNRIDGQAAARITVSRGASGRGLFFPADDAACATVLITVSAMPPAPPAPAKLIVSRFTRSEQSVSSRCKTLNYLDNVMARNEAVGAGADEAAMLNSAGRVACVSAGNVFVMAENGIMTPPATEGALPGIVRGLLLGADADIGEGAIAPAVLRSRPAFITNSLVGLRAATVEENEAVWDAHARKMLQRLQSWYEKRLQDDLAERMKTS